MYDMKCINGYYDLYALHLVQYVGWQDVGFGVKSVPLAYDERSEEGNVVTLTIVIYIYIYYK